MVLHLYCAIATRSQEPVSSRLVLFNNTIIKTNIMAIAIKTIPVLRDKVASAFVAKANQNSSKKEKIDFSKQTSIASKILSKSKI